MAAILISDEIYARLAQQATARNLTVEQFVAPILNQAASDSRAPSLPEPSFDHWKQNFERWQADIQARADRYPAGFQLDDSRASIYDGCGE